jgi:hypothetical protein
MRAPFDAARFVGEVRVQRHCPLRARTLADVRLALANAKFARYYKAAAYVRRMSYLGAHYIDWDEAEKARPARYQRLIELLAPTRIVGEPFARNTRFVFFSDPETIEGCADILDPPNPGSPINTEKPPIVVDLDDHVLGLSLSYLDYALTGVALIFGESFVLDPIDVEGDKAYPSLSEDQLVEAMDGVEVNIYPTLAALRQGISDWLECERRRPTRTQDRRPSSYSNIRRSRLNTAATPLLVIPKLTLRAVR